MRNGDKDMTNAVTNVLIVAGMAAIMFAANYAYLVQ